MHRLLGYTKLLFAIIRADWTKIMRHTVCILDPSLNLEEYSPEPFETEEPFLPRYEQPQILQPLPPPPKNVLTSILQVLIVNRTKPKTRI